MNWKFRGLLERTVIEFDDALGAHAAVLRGVLAIDVTVVARTPGERARPSRARRRQACSCRDIGESDYKKHGRPVSGPGRLGPDVNRRAPAGIERRVITKSTVASGSDVQG